MNFEQIAKAWRIVGADIAGLKWDDFAKALAEQPPQQCTGCEGNPSPQNNPCALCGQPAQQEPAFYRDSDSFLMTLDRAKLLGLDLNDLQPLYTSPPAQRTWVGLTNQEREAVIDNSLTPACVVLATEAKLKEKNT